MRSPPSHVAETDGWAGWMLMEVQGEINNAGPQSIIHELAQNCLWFEGGLKTWRPGGMERRGALVSKAAGPKCDDLRGACLIAMPSWCHQSQIKSFCLSDRFREFFFSSKFFNLINT